MALVTASTTPTKPRANNSAGASDGPAASSVASTIDAAGGGEEGVTQPPQTDLANTDPAHTGSLARRMMMIAAGWIFALLLIGGLALDRALTGLVTNQFDEQLELSLMAMVSSAELDPFGEVFFNRPLGDQRFLEPGSGFYWQISAPEMDAFASRSLWDERLEIDYNRDAVKPAFYYSNQFADERLRVVQRSINLPGSETQWQFVVAASLADLDNELADIRAILIWSFVLLGLGLLLMAAVQTWYGLGPLRRVRRAIARIRGAGTNRVTDPLPLEVQPMVQELNALLEHSEKQAEEARTHAGNLAHALKTPLTVVTNAASLSDPELNRIVMREVALMRRQVDHHLARARAVGRRGIGLSRANVMESARGVERAVSRLYPEVRFDIAGKGDADVAVERQDLDEMLGNAIENAAKYGGGSVFVTLDADPVSEHCVIWVEDDGPGIPEEERTAIFARGARLDTEKPGTGLGLAILRDVAEIYGGWVALSESEDLGGLLAELHLPRA